MAKFLVKYKCIGDMVVDAENEEEARDIFEGIDWDKKMGSIYVTSDEIEEVSVTERRY